MNREQTLDVARKAVLTERAATHGPLDSSFGLIAGLWSPLVGHDITPAQVCLMLAALKIARAWDNPGHDDNWTDLAGYAACGAEVARRDGPDPAAAPDWTTLLRETTPVSVRNGSRNYIVETPADLAALDEQVDALRTLNRELEGARQAEEPAPARAAGGDEGGERAAQTAPAPVAVPTPAAQDRQGPPPSDAPTLVEPPRGGKPGPARWRDKVSGLWRGTYTDDERAVVIAGAVAGKTSGQIAKKLERPAQNISVLMSTTLKAQIAAARAEQIGTGARAAVLPTPAPAPSTPGAVVAAAETAGTPPAEAPGETDGVTATEAARRIAEALRDPAALEYWKITGLPEWVALIDDARAVQSWTLENDRQLLDLIGERWTPGDIANLTERTLDELKARKVQLTCAGKWPLAEVAAALGVEA